MTKVFVEQPLAVPGSATHWIPFVLGLMIRYKLSICLCVWLLVTSLMVWWGLA